MYLNESCSVERHFGCIERVVALVQVVVSVNNSARLRRICGSDYP